MKTELVTTLKRHATKMLDDLAEDRHPVLITHHGMPAAYLVHVDAFDQLRRRLAILEGIARGERSIEAGRILSHTKATARMKRWLK